MTVEDVTAMLRRLVPYKLDGITVSGGEPLSQWEFTSGIMRGAHSLGMTSTLDTSGVGSKTAVCDVLNNTDEVLWCIKSAVPETYRKITGASSKNSLRFGEELGKHPNIGWNLRYVILPGYTDNAREIEAMIKYAKEGPAATSLKAVELLPYHRLGLHKWEELGIEYKLPDMLPPDEETVRRIQDGIRDAGLKVV